LEILDHHFSQICMPFQKKEACHILDIALKDEKFETQAWLNRRDGRCYWAHYEIYPFIDSHCELRGFTLILKDKTYKLQLETESNNIEQRLQSFINCIKDYAILMMNTHGIILTWNEGAQHIKGYTSEEIIGKCFSIFYSKKDREKGIPQHAL